MEVNEPRTVYIATGNDIDEKSYRKKDYLFPFNLTVGRIANIVICIAFGNLSCTQ